MTHLLTSLKQRLCLLSLAALSLLGIASPAQAVIGAHDNVPAATLLLPYFEVDLANENGAQTSIRLTNSSASASMTRVTLWTDWGIPTHYFNVYLTGYDSSEIDLRLIFKGHIPRTADAGDDPSDTISPRSPIAQDINFPSSTVISTQLPPATVTGLRNAHTGLASSLLAGNCGGRALGDNLARGYVTIDDLRTGDLTNASNSAAYLQNTLGSRNLLLGSAITINRSLNLMSSEALVHIEASTTNPITNTSGEPTFYGAINGYTATDKREPLGTSWQVRYMNGGLFPQGSSVIVWQDPGQIVNPVACGNTPAPFPLSLGVLAAFDEQEQVVRTPVIFGTPLGSSLTSFPVVTQRVAASALTPFSFGFLNLNFNTISGNAVTARRQAVVSVQHRANGRFMVATPGIRISSAADPIANQPTYP
jgi:hypothetical protein